MTLAAIVAHDPNLVIGKDGDLPWHYSEDLKYFKNTTMGHPLIMGRVVFEELGETPLPGRENIVLSQSRTYENVPTFGSFEAALEYVRNDELVFLAGGGNVYRQFLDQCDKLYVTEIHESYDGDTYFPEYRNDIGTTWTEIKRDDRDELSFVVYERNK
jgi:dihydrofolate reductase